jgi:hypothetical protein
MKNFIKIRIPSTEWGKTLSIVIAGFFFLSAALGLALCFFKLNLYPWLVAELGILSLVGILFISFAIVVFIEDLVEKIKKIKDGKRQNS